MTRTSRTRSLVLAAGVLLGVLVPTSSAFGLTPPAPIGPGDITLGDNEPDQPHPHGPDDKVAPPVDPCTRFGCLDDVAAEPGDPGDPTDPSDDTVSGRPDFTG